MIRLLLAWQMFSPTDPAGLRPLYEQVIELRKTQHGEASAEAAAAMADYGRFLIRISDPAAHEWLSRALSIRDSLDDKQALALSLEKTDRPRAEALHQEVGENAKGELAAVSWSRLGNMAEARNAAPIAEKAYRAAVAASASEEKLAIRLNELALFLKGKGSLKEAEPLLRRAVAIQQKGMGAKSPELGATLNDLSGLLLDLKRPAEAEPHARRAVEIFEGTLGPTHVRTGIAASNLADVLAARGLNAEALKRYKQALAIFEKELSPDHPWTRDVRQALRP